MKRRMRLAGSTTVVPIREHCGGYLAEGPGFYIWDEALEEVVRTVRLLESGAERGLPKTTRIRLARDFRSSDGPGTGRVALPTDAA